MNWGPVLEAAKVRDHMIAALLSLLLWLPVAYQTTQQHHSAAELAAQAAASDITRNIAALESAMQRTATTAQLLPVVLQSNNSTEFLRAIHRLGANSDSGLTIEFAPQAGPSLRFDVSKMVDTSQIQLDSLINSTGVPMGDPVWAIRDGAIVVSLTMFTVPNGHTRPRLWGHVSASLPLSAAIAKMQLPNVASSGIGAYLRYQQDSASPPAAILDTRTFDSGPSVSRTLPVPRNGQLVLDVETPKPPTLQIALSWSAGLLILIPLYFLLLQLRVRPPGRDAEVSMRMQANSHALANLEQEVRTRMHAEKLLERSHRMLDAMFEHLPGMVVIKRASDLRIARINQSGEALLGKSRELVVGRSSDELHSAELSTLLTQTDHLAMAERRVIDLPVQRVSMPGQGERWVRFRKVALFDRYGEPEYVLEFGEDETERESLDRRLMEHLNFLEQLIEAVPAPLFFKDVEGRYISVNTAFEQLIGKTRAELIGKTVFDFCTPSLAYVYQRADQELLNAGGNQIYESSVQTIDGHSHDVIFHKAVFRATTGTLGGIVGIMLDISGRKQAESRIGQLNRVLTMLSETSQAIVRIHDRTHLLEEIIRLIQEHGEFPVAWVQLKQHNRGGNLFASPPTEYRLASRICQHGNWLTANSTETLETFGLDELGSEIQREYAEKGSRRFIQLRLKQANQTIGGIGLLTSDTHEMSMDERRMLTDLADNISFALDALAEAETRKKVQDRLDLSARVFDNSTEGIVITDAQNNILMVNKAFSEVTGYSAHEVIGRNPRLLNSGRQDDAFYQELWESLIKNGEWRGEIENRRRNGEIYPEWLNISVVRNENGEISNYVAVFSDLTNRKKIEAKLDFLAYYDPLTALSNRTQLKERLLQLLNHPVKRIFGLITLDIDRFKLINDSLGQQKGDAVLLAVAERLKMSAPEAACVSRLDGDQFAILLDNLTGPEDAAGVVRAIQRNLASSSVMDGQDIRLSVSQGISIFPEDGQNFEDLAGSAETAMYAASAAGGNTYRFFRQDMNSRAAERIRMESRLHAALEHDEFRVYFQPLVSGKTGRIVGAEALLRWFNDDLGGFVPPSAFIPLLEETGLIVPVGEWVLRTACEENRRWRAVSSGSPFVAVNLSALQLSDELLVSKVRQVIEDLNVPEGHLEIELTESAILRDTDDNIRTLQELKNLGVRLSIDDFGTGYSSLSYLRQLPVDTLKIDRSFVMETPGNSATSSIVRAIVAMGHSLQLDIVGEGVELPEQVNFMRELGTDILQGYHFSKPLPARDFLALINSHDCYPLPLIESPVLQLAASSTYERANARH